jgi:tetratricopeptide (TPR) repeat protein
MMRASKLFAIQCFLLLLPGFALAQKETIESFEQKREETQPQEVQKRKGPIGIKDIAAKKEIKSEKKLDEAISTLKQLIAETPDDDPAKPEYLSRLADLYWDKGEALFNRAYGNEMFQRIKAAQDAGDEKAVAELEAEQRALLQQMQYWQEQCVKVYKGIVDNYPEYPSLDAVLYYLGYTLVQINKPDEAYPYFARIIRESPTSSFVPEALLNIAEYFYNSGRVEEALKVYSEVEKFPASSAYGLAIYKKGWCYINLHQFEDAMSHFLKVIEYAGSEAAKKSGYGAVLMRDAQRDLVMAYSQVGNPDNAIPVFKKISPEGYLELAVRLAEGYSSQGEFEKSIRVYKHLIAETKDRNDAYRVIEFQRGIFENAVKIRVLAKIVEEARRLTGVLEKFAPQAPQKYVAEEKRKIEGLLGVTAYDYYKEVSTTKDERSTQYTIVLLHEYLRLFSDAPEAYKMTYFYGKLLAQVGKYSEAAEVFNRVVEMSPDGELSKDAAHFAVVNYFKSMVAQETKVKAEEETNLEPTELSDVEKKLVEACERYLRLAGPQDEDIVEAKFAAGVAYYNHNHFDKAAKLFREIIEQNPDHQNAPSAARLLLSSLHLSRNIKALNEAAERIAREPKLMVGAIPKIVESIREQADFNKCYEFEQSRQFKVAGDCFLSYVDRFPNTPLKDKALIAAGANYFKARLVEKSLEVNARLYTEMPKSPLAPKAFYNIGETYRRLAVYSEAARMFEEFVRRLPKHENAEEALRYAIIFRSGLGEYAEAVKDMEQYLKLFPDSKHVPSVFLEIGVALEKQGKLPMALQQYQAFVKKYGKGASGDLFLKALLGIARVYKGMKRDKEADAAYAKVVEEYNNMTEEEKNSLTTIGLGAAAEARFMQGEKVLQAVREIKIVGGEAQVNAAIQKKLGLLKDAMEIFASVEAFGQPHWTIAAFSRKGFGLQEMALAIEGVPPPPQLTPEQKEIFRAGMAEKAQPIWERAKEEFRRCVTVAQKLKWFNKYSEEAEEALMKLDPSFAAVPHIKPQIGRYTLLINKPRLLPLKEGEDAPGWDDGDLQAKIQSAVSAPDPSAQALYNMGALLEASEKFLEAKEYYTKAISKDPSLADAYGRLGRVFAATGHPDKAQEFLSKALEIDQMNSVANNYYAAQYIREGKFKDAIGNARKALVSDPDSMDAYLILASAYYEMGLLDAGTLVCRNAIGLDEKNAPIYNMLGLIFSKKGEVSQAAAMFDKAVQSDPNAIDAHMNLGALTLGYKDFETAGEHFKRVLEKEPNNIQAKLGLSVALAKMERTQEAIATLEDLIKNMDLPEAHFNLCLVYQDNLGDYEKALTECERFLTIAGAQHPKAREVQLRIQGLKTMIDIKRGEQK